jgi:predicted NBD/HSP70 family sugar kinase
MSKVAMEPRSRRPGARESILDVIRAAEPLSRVELAAMTGLTGASVSTIVRRLIEDGLVVESGRTRTAGKPRTLLQLNPAARFAVGIHVGSSSTTCVLTGQTAGVMSRLAHASWLDASPAELVEQLHHDIDVLIDASGLDRDRCLGIGLVWAGPHAGTARARSTTTGMQDREALQAREGLAAATGWPVLVENDATAAAVGEYWIARVDSTRSFAALYMDGGIGSGIIIDGAAYRGMRANAGEFGHMCLEVDGPECWCGSRGCLEALAGPAVVVSRAFADPEAAAEAGLEGIGLRATPVDFAAIARAARSGAPRCRALLEDSARYVAAAAESVVNLLDIDLLVLTGPSFAAASFVYGPAITSRVAPADAKTWRRSVSVTVSSAAATASATGAAALLLQELLRG